MKALSIAVGTPVEVTTPSLPGGTTGQTYSQTLAATGGTTPYTWSVVSGGLPPGLTLGSTTGTISGTPTADGSYTFTVQVTDAANPARTDQQALSIAVAQGLSITTTSPLSPCKVNVSCSRTVQATGGTGSYTWTHVSGSLPPGLTLAPTGVISGTPTKAGNYTFRLRVVAGELTAEKDFSLKVNNKR